MANACLRCTECTKGSMGNICPIMDCPKGLVNGPCGGSHQGKCEVGQAQKCAWMEIFRISESVKMSSHPLDLLKDYSKLAKQKARRG